MVDLPESMCAMMLMLMSLFFPHLGLDLVVVSMAPVFWKQTCCKKAVLKLYMEDFPQLSLKKMANSSISI